MIDSHAHIYSDKFKNDVDEMIDRSQEKGVGKILMPNIDHQSIDGMLGLEEKYPNQCYPMMGLHPCSVGKDFEKELYIVEEWLSKKDFIAVGEMGLDLYWDKTFFEQQKEAFRIQTDFAKKYNKPLVIHTRESMAETLALLEELADDSLKGVVHCFTGNEDDAKRITETGFYLGIGGVATFKNGGLDKVLPSVSLEKILLETDSPYLAPIPYRGKRNEPSYIPLIAQKIADIKGVGLDEVASVTTENTQKLFDLK